LSHGVITQPDNLNTNIFAKLVMPPVNKRRRAAQRKLRTAGGAFGQVLVPLIPTDHSDGSDAPDWGDEEDGGWDSQVEEQEQQHLLPSLGLEWVTNSDFERSKRGPYGMKGV
jgi:hypothetical protein